MEHLFGTPVNKIETGTLGMSERIANFEVVKLLTISRCLLCILNELTQDEKE